MVFLLYLSLCMPLGGDGDGVECAPQPASAAFAGDHPLRDCRREAVRLHRLDERLRGRCRKARGMAAG